MEPMKPMTPMAPMRPIERWWPENLGSPSSVGSQNDLRYAFFRDQRRLVVERAGKFVIYDTGDHDIGSVAQASGRLPSVEFSSQRGPVRLEELTAVG